MFNRIRDIGEIDQVGIDGGIRSIAGRLIERKAVGTEVRLIGVFNSSKMSIVVALEFPSSVQRRAPWLGEKRAKMGGGKTHTLSTTYAHELGTSTKETTDPGGSNYRC